MQTLRRGRKQKFIEILSKYYIGINEGVLNELLDAAESRTERKTDELKGAYNIKGVEAAIFQGRTVTEEDLPAFENREKAAIDAFEQALGIPSNWQWYPAKTTDEKVWRDFRAYLVKLYEADNQCFVKYSQWRRKPFAKGAVAISTIKRDPSIFASSWADFLASDAMYGNAPRPAVAVDKDGIPETY